MAEAIDKAVADFKQLLQESDDFQAIGNAFYDLAEFDAFLDKGAPEDNEELATLLAVGAERLFSRPCSIPYSMFVHVPEYDFYHGPALIDEHSATIFYFSDIKVGMLIVITDMSEGKTEFIRLTTALLDRPSLLADPETPATD